MNARLFTRHLNKENRSFKRFCVVVLLILSNLLGFSPSGHTENIRVAVAANFATTLKTLAQHYQATKIATSIGSSGLLFNQIRQGAPYDVFFSADCAKPSKLVALGRAQRSLVYATGSLYVIVQRENAPQQCLDKQAHACIQQLLSSIRYFAQANPQLAPYGQASTQVLSQFSNIIAQPIHALNIAQTYALFVQGAVPMAFIAASQTRLQAQSMSPAIHIAVPTSWHDPIQQCLAVITPSTTVARFLLFLQSATAIDVLYNAGYSQ